MTRATFAPLIGPEFDSFLTASVGDDANGGRLSVLSAFARTDLDPWAEALSLAAMSHEKATARLAAFITAIPNRPAADIPANTIAGNLVALLPKLERYAPQAPAALSKILAPSQSRFGLGFSAIALLIVLALMVLAESRSGPEGKPNPVAPTAHSAEPPTTLGR